jgi:mannose-6-phosphate isomerase-like protein (cupin superfamily)
MKGTNSIIITVMTIMISSLTNYGQAGTDNFKIIEYSKMIEEGKELENNLLFDGVLRNITQIIMRNSNSLGSHAADMPFLLFCVDGYGKLVLGDDNKAVMLQPGSMVTVEAGVSHDVAAEPELSILVIRFLSDLKN